MYIWLPDSVMWNSSHCEQF